MAPSTAEVPPDVLAAAQARASARAERDWVTADRLRGEIEAQGWKVVDSGTAFRLEPAHPADVAVAGAIRYGRSEAVPTRLGDAPIGIATAIVVAREDSAGARRAVAALLAHAEPGVDVVLVIDGLDDDAAPQVDEAAVREGRVEIIRTSVPLGQGAALNVGLRRSRAPVIVVVDASIEPTGDVVSPLVAALDAPGVAVAGPFGLRSDDLRHFEESTADPAAAIEGYVMAFRRADAIERGPFDEGFRFYRNLDVWWSLVLRDEGEGRPSREARVVGDLPLLRHEHLAWSATRAAERAKLSKRNFYRVLDRFRERSDLAVG
ncbi:MAG TPA: glycosyltransferase [Candidatus Limnocylindrales bacterium]|nr:glycosyltransferase [Candidatus Limnocylindrales bacterium]